MISDLVIESSAPVWMIDNDTPGDDFISLIESSAQVWMINNDTPGNKIIFSSVNDQ